jgi:diacylglycerol kinase (ATP)
MSAAVRALMAKHATLSSRGSPQDGRSEVICVPHTARWRVLSVALKATTRGLGSRPTATRYVLTTLEPTPMQLEGEVLALDPRTRVPIAIAPAALATIT